MNVIKITKRLFFVLVVAIPWMLVLVIFFLLPMASAAGWYWILFGEHPMDRWILKWPPQWILIIPEWFVK